MTVAELRGLGQQRVKLSVVRPDGSFTREFHPELVNPNGPIAAESTTRAQFPEGHRKQSSGWVMSGRRLKIDRGLSPAPPSMSNRRGAFPPRNPPPPLGEWFRGALPHFQLTPPARRVAAGIPSMRLSVAERLADSSSAASFPCGENGGRQPGTGPRASFESFFVDGAVPPPGWDTGRLRTNRGPPVLACGRRIESEVSAVLCPLRR